MAVYFCLLLLIYLYMYALMNECRSAARRSKQAVAASRQPRKRGEPLVLRDNKGITVNHYSHFECFVESRDIS